MKKIFVIIFSTLIMFGLQTVMNTKYASAEVSTEQPASQFTLTQEQLKELNNLKNKMYSELSSQVPNLSEHLQMITDIYNGGSATSEQLNAFNKEVKSSNVKINTNYERELERILTPDQRNTYKQMKKDLEKQLNNKLQNQ